MRHGLSIRFAHSAWLERLFAVMLAAVLACTPLEAQADLAPLKVTTNVAPSPGFLYLAPNCRISPRPFGSYMAVYNVNGGLLKSGVTTNYPFEFKVLPDGRLAYSELIVFAGTSFPAGIYIVDTTLTIVDSIEQKRGYLATQHDFHLLPNGNRVILGAEDVTLDLSQVLPNGNPAATVVQAVIQEVDIDGKVLIQWKSLDHLPVSLSYEDLTAPAIRYIHNNSLWIDHDGNWLVSMRHASMIVKVNRLTGSVMWILGGKANQFTFIGEHEENAPTYFSYQHDIRRLPNGHITLFDNGTQHTPQYSRAVEYEIDEVNKTCRLIRDYRHNPDIYVGIQGGVQPLEGGNYLIGWGSAANEGAPGVTEVDSAGNVVFEAYYPKQMFVYRATKHPFWPPGRPTASITVRDVAEGETYRYSNATKDAGLRVRFTKLSSFFYNTTTARRFMWAPVNPHWTGDVPDAKQVRVDIALDGIKDHELELRFNVDTLGIAADAESMIVYHRAIPDTAFPEDGGTFTALQTRYDAAMRELVVSKAQAGEFAFAIPTTLPEGIPRTPVLISPIGGSRLIELRENTLRVTIHGRADSLRIQVSNDKTFSSIVFDSVNTSDRMTFATPAAERVMYWRAQAIADSRSSAFSAVDSFTVGNAFVDVERPDANATWTIDSAYVITWQTNISGNVRLELVRPGPQPPIVIRDSVRVDAGGFLWRLPFDVPSGNDYHVRIVALDPQYASVEDIGDATITVNGVTSAVEFTTVVGADPIVVLYPQPATESFTIDIASTITRVSIFDVSGVQRGTFANNYTQSFNIRALPTGTYTVVVEDTKGRVHMRTLMVQH